MKLVVLLALVSVAMGRPPPCDEYCKTLWFSTQLPPPWDPLCDCAKRQAPPKSFNGKPVYTATTIFKLDDTGIYFDPSNMHQVDGVTYINQPFYIVNNLEDFLTKPPITANKKAAAGIHVGQSNPEMKTVKLNTKNNVNLGDSITYKSYSYSYPKEDVPKTKTDYKTMDLDNTDGLNKMGQGYSKCMDVYFMIVSKLYNNGSKLAKIWGKNKYHKFSKLSIEDLMLTLHQECDESEDFIIKSVEDLLNQRLKKSVESNNEGSTQKMQQEPFLEPNLKAKAKNIDTGSSSDNSNFKTSGIMGPEESYPISVPPIDTSDVSTLPSDAAAATSPAQDSTKLDVKIATPIAEPFETLKPDITDMDHRSMNNNKPKEEKYLYNNLTVYDDLHATNSPQWISVYDLKTSIEGDDSDKKNINRAIEKYPNSTIGTHYTKDLETSTVIYVNNRPIYKENEVAPQRVITREFANDVVDSVINGTEDLQRDDSIDEEGEDVNKPPDALVLGGPQDSDQTVQVEIDDQQIPLLIGNFYFRFGGDYIPAKFVQKSNGKLHVAIDGANICGKINLEGDEKSPVLSGLCEKFPNNQNN